jgi:cysteine dioxygenase
MSSAVIPILPLSTGLSPGYTHYTPQYNLEDLVQDIKAHLGESGGISSADVDNEYLISLAKKYISDPNDWARYFYNDSSKAYTRNAIENINQKANIVSIILGHIRPPFKTNEPLKLLLVWNPGKGSPIHDHANAHCIMKVLAGTLQETVYEIPDQGSSCPGPLEIKSDSRHTMNDVAYISDDIGLHRVYNPSSDQVAVSLHCESHFKKSFLVLGADKCFYSVHTSQCCRLWIQHLQ